VDLVENLGLLLGVATHGLQLALQVLEGGIQVFITPSLGVGELPVHEADVVVGGFLVSLVDALALALDLAHQLQDPRDGFGVRFRSCRVQHPLPQGTGVIGWQSFFLCRLL